MDPNKPNGDPKSGDSRSEENEVSRAPSHDALDTSSTSSLSISDHSRPQQTADGQKSGECSPRQPMDEALKSEKAFIEFVMSLPPKETPDHHHHHHHISSDSVSGPKSKGLPSASGATTKVGLDHLDNLCKLMEQLSELRDTNNKLQRRVQYLEDLKTLHDMHKEISEETHVDCTQFVNKPRTSYELQKSATETFCPKEDVSRPPSRPHSSKYQSRRGRTQSADGQRRERSKSVGHEENGEDPKSKRIFPKWSKVKEAFGWESDRKDSMKIMKSDGGNLQVPRRCSDDSHHSFHPPKSPTWSQDFPSLHSSLEDVHEILDSGRWKRCSVASEKSVLRIETPKEALRRQKSTPSPGSEKIIPHRELQDLKPKSSTIERDTYSHLEYSKFEKEDGKRGKSPWGRVKTIIERRRDSLKRRSLRREHTCSECCEPPSLPARKCPEECDCADRHPPDTHKQRHYVPEAIVIDEEVDYGGPRTPSSSPTFHRKSRWTRVKKVLKGKKEDDGNPSLSTPASPNSGQDGHFTFESIEEPTQDECDDEGREMKRVGSESHVHQLALSAPTCDLMLQLQRNLSEDFHRKIREWEHIRASTGVASPHWDCKPIATRSSRGAAVAAGPSLVSRSRKKSERDDNKGITKPKLNKDLTWLEKELQKIEKEKQRLSKERQKYEERGLRLERLKETVLRAGDTNKREVLVRTSAGEFRFEGISDAFTKKLYEWETKRGLGPELSTIALLDSSRLTVQTNLGPKSGPLQRVVSRSESSLADVGQQPSHNSSNSLPSLKIPEPMDAADRTNQQPSRANSEPDLSTLVALANGSNVSVSNLSRQADDSLEDVLSPRGGSEDEKGGVVSRNDSETYYSLLEENVILLEQLKDKEEICSRLETELQVLDKKVDLMDKHHTQETELYREKLWEMHKPGATPRDVQCCLRTMAQLRKRIEVLEKCTEKLRNDRESVEDSFRYHSKQQEDMTLDLLQKMSELQAAGSSNTDCESKDYIPHRMDVSAVERLQDLSALLVKQTQELQETLSAKSRQICQLRWELLHRDLSTVKLETELHTHTAHRKRSKYAHYRSHSSEEASSTPAPLLPQELECGKSTILTEAYYNATSHETEFQATELTNTVQQLKKEVLKLASSATECPRVDYETPESSPIRTSKEKPWSKIGSKIRDKAKAITVRRSSADNLSSMSSRDEVWKSNAQCSSDSDDSTDDGYTKINLRAVCKNNNTSNPNAERLLMSSSEYPPRGYLQRKKKLQKMSSPNRRRSNTFHIKREFEKPTVCNNTPQKCYSFRYPTEKVPDCTAVKNASNAINIRNLLGEVKYQEFLKKKAQMLLNNNSQTIGKNQNFQLISNDVPGNQILREVASDSKIPFLFQVQYRTENFLRDKLSNKYPVRSMSDKQRKEIAVERRENFQKRKSKRHVTSPDLFSTLSENTKARLLAINSQQHQNVSKSEPGQESAIKVKPAIKFQTSERVSPSQSNIPTSNVDSSTVTVHLPKRKLKKPHLRMPDNSNENTEETVTIVIPKKRSLSSEQEFESSVNFSFPRKETPQQSSRLELSEQDSCTDSDLQNIQNSSENRNESTVSTASTVDELQDEAKSRKRKAEDGDSSSQDASYNPESVEQQDSSNFITNRTHPNDISEKQERFQRRSTNYVKSPSAPHLNWRNVCAKKISREGAPNVRLLIEKYNRVAESQVTRSPNASNFSSPSSSRKISAPLTNSQSDRSIAPYSFSTPTSPSIMSDTPFKYNPLTFRPANLDLFPNSPPSSPRTEALRRAKEDFISSQNNKPSVSGRHSPHNQSTLSLSRRAGGGLENYSPTSLTLPANITGIRRAADEDGVSHCSMDSASLVMFRTGETCKESRLSKRSVESRTEPDRAAHNLKTSKSLSNSSIFKSVLSSDFKIPSTFLKLKRSKRKKDMDTVSHLCRQSLLLTVEDTAKAAPAAASHKSCPSSPELKSKSAVRPNWFHRNILRQK